MGNNWPVPMSRARQVTLYAHRGASAELPENTLAAFIRALELGADALESDLHMTRDGHIVMAHDVSGRRMCGVPLAIRRSSLEEVARWDAGWGFLDRAGERSEVGRGHCIPTLEHVLRELPGVRLNLDIKQARPSMVERLLEIVRESGAEDRVTLASFSLTTMLAVRRRGYGQTCLPKPEVLAMMKLPETIYRALPCRGTAAQLPLSAGGFQFDTASVIDRCHRLGLRIDYWTVNDAATAARLCDLGADGIMTDDPKTVAPAIRAWRGRDEARNPPGPAAARP